MTTIHPPHIESVKHKTTSVTMVASEFEADVRIESKQQVADGVVTLTLREVGNHPLPAWGPGAHIDLILEKVPTRQYSLCGNPADHHVWRLGILRDPNGRGSSLYVHDQLQVNDTSGCVVHATTSHLSTRRGICSSPVESASPRSCP